jgi:WD40 repeat protein
MRFTVPGKVAHRYLAIGPSGATLAAVANEGVTRAGDVLATHFWQPPNATEVAKNPVGTNRSGLIATPCALSADAQYLATDQGYGTVAVRQTRDGRTIASVNHPGNDSICAFSADSRLLATSGSDIVRVWEVATRVETARIEGTTELQGIVFSPRGRYLASISRNDVSRVWLLEPADLIEVACRRLSRNLSRDEKRDYFGDAPYRATCPNIPVPAADPKET